jgi:hypothetical protein
LLHYMCGTVYLNMYTCTGMVPNMVPDKWLSGHGSSDIE